MFSTFLLTDPFMAAEPKRKRTEKPSSSEEKSSSQDTPDVAATIRKLEQSRHNEKVRFKRCIKAAENLYHQVFKFMLKFREMMKKHSADQDALTKIKEKARERFDVLLKRLNELSALTWREQTRGPTSSRSWSISVPDDSKHHPALWILWTRPAETTIRDDEDAPSLNFDQGPFLTWGLPKNKSGAITLNTAVYTKGKPVFVIEKYQERDSDGKTRVQHRIKGLYFLFKNIKPKSTKAALVAWEDLINGWFKDTKIEKSAPAWIKD